MISEFCLLASLSFHYMDIYFCGVEGREGGCIECRWYDVSGVSREGGEYERGFPSQNLESRSTREAFLSLFLVKVSGFKLNFESQFDIFYAIFCFNFS